MSRQRSRMPILTSGRLLVQRGVIDAPQSEPDSDWAALAIVTVDEDDAVKAGRKLTPLRRLKTDPPGDDDPPAEPSRRRGGADGSARL